MHFLANNVRAASRSLNGVTFLTSNWFLPFSTTLLEAYRRHFLCLQIAHWFLPINVAMGGCGYDPAKVMIQRISSLSRYVKELLPEGADLDLALG